MKLFLVTMLMACIPFVADAQFMMFGGGNRPNQDSLRKIVAADYADMLAKVGCGQPREGRQPNNPDASKHPNYDELTANPYPFYPDPLVTEGGNTECYYYAGKLLRQLRNAPLLTVVQDNMKNGAFGEEKIAVANERANADSVRVLNYNGDKYKVYFGYGVDFDAYKKWHIVNYYRSLPFYWRNFIYNISRLFAKFCRKKGI